MNVAVVGLGKVGLVLAAQYASRGVSVVGCDIDDVKVAAVNGGRSPVTGEEGLQEAVSAAVASGKLRATTDTADGASRSDIVVIITKVALDAQHSVDFSQLDAAVADIARGIRSGTLVVVETTVPVGTTRHRVGEALATSGRDVLLAASPERVSSGRIFRDLGTYPKVIGPLDEASWERAEAFYAAALPKGTPVLRVSDPETAELSKIAEGVYRDVNIALANELARHADALGIDAREAFAAANSQPYSHIHEPGLGVGGHCVPVYPYFLPLDEQSLALEARRANDAMAHYGVDRLEAAIGSLKGATVLILGLAYRPNVKESANSSALLVAEALRDRGAAPLVHDPLFSSEEVRAHGLTPPDPFPPEHVDAIIVQAWHDAYRDIDLRTFSGCRALLDGRSSLDRATVEAEGITYVSIGG